MITCLVDTEHFSKKMPQLKVSKKSSNELIENIDNLVNQCRFNEALQLLNTLKNPTDYYRYNLLKHAANIFKNNGFDDVQAQHFWQLAFSVLESQQLYFCGSDIDIIDNCVHYSIYVDAPIEAIFDVNLELAGVFVDNIAQRRNDILIFEYESVAILEERKKHERIV